MLTEAEFAEYSKRLFACKTDGEVDALVTEIKGSGRNISKDMAGRLRQAIETKRKSLEAQAKAAGQS
ncbi:MAG TPA: hypothetical protein PKV97_00005 [Thauera aminoaromatica]|nr:hypothetical protein [Thauera aminoaromatica]